MNVEAGCSDQHTVALFHTACPSGSCWAAILTKDTPETRECMKNEKTGIQGNRKTTKILTVLPANMCFQTVVGLSGNLF